MKGLNPFEDIFGFFQGFIIMWVVFAIIIIVVILMIIYFVIKALTGSSERKSHIKSSAEPYPYKIEETKKMKYCEFCGQQIASDTVICPYCDSKVK
ncbi:MAG: hypothetical protein ACFFKA_09840 [Candidatus Thorarchaeota archaeon]